MKHQHFRALLMLLLFAFTLETRASCLIQNDIALSDARLASREAWAHCSLGDAKLYDSFYETKDRAFKTISGFKSVTPEQMVLLTKQHKQSVINREVMRRVLLPVEEGGEGRRAILSVQSDYRDELGGEVFSLSGVGSLIAEVGRLPNNRMTPLNSKTRYFVLTAAHLIGGENLRVLDSLGAPLALGRTFVDEDADLAVIEVTRDPLMQPLAYFAPGGISQKLATYLYDINYSSEDTTDRFSGYTYPVTPLSSVAFTRAPGFLLGRFEKSESNSDSFYSFPLMQRNADNSVSFNRSLKAGASGTPVVSDTRDRYLSITSVMTYSSSTDSSIAAGSKQIERLLSLASRNAKTSTRGRWLFFGGLPAHQFKDRIEIFFREKPIGNGIYVNGKGVRPRKEGALPKLDSDAKKLNETFLKLRRQNPKLHLGPVEIESTIRDLKAQGITVIGR